MHITTIVFGIMCVFLGVFFVLAGFKHLPKIPTKKGTDIIMEGFKYGHPKVITIDKDKIRWDYGNGKWYEITLN